MSHNEQRVSLHSTLVCSAASSLTWDAITLNHCSEELWEFHKHYHWTMVHFGICDKNTARTPLFWTSMDPLACLSRFSVKTTRRPPINSQNVLLGVCAIICMDIKIGHVERGRKQNNPRLFPKYWWPLSRPRETLKGSHRLQQRKFSAFYLTYFMKINLCPMTTDLYIWSATPWTKIMDTYTTPPPPIQFQTTPLHPTQCLSSKSDIPFPSGASQGSKAHLSRCG